MTCNEFFDSIEDTIRRIKESDNATDRLMLTGKLIAQFDAIHDTPYSIRDWVKVVDGQMVSV